MPLTAARETSRPMFKLRRQRYAEIWDRLLRSRALTIKVTVDEILYGKLETQMEPEWPTETLLCLSHCFDIQPNEYIYNLI